MSELAEVKKEIKGIKAEITDIKDNHLTSIKEKIAAVASQVKNLRWFIMASMLVLGVVLSILHVFG